MIPRSADCRKRGKDEPRDKIQNTLVGSFAIKPYGGGAIHINVKHTEGQGSRVANPAPMKILFFVFPSLRSSRDSFDMDEQCDYGTTGVT